MAAANCEQTPRQKMIQMMYLFYTALLALNVSGEIINAFVYVNDSLVQTTENFHSKTKSLYSKLEGLNAMQPEKYSSTHEKAMEIKKGSDKLVSNIQRLKWEIVRNADGPDADINNIEKKDNLDAAPEIMIGEQGPMKGDSLRMWVEDYREMLLGLEEVSDTSSTIYHNIMSALETKDDLKDPEEPKTWQEKLFKGMPLVGSIALMTKLQADVRNTEADVIERLITCVDELDVTITDIEAVVNATKSYVVRGGSYEANVFIAARDTSLKPTIFYSTKYPFYDTIDAGKDKYEMRGELGVDYDTLLIVDGKGKYMIENCQNVGTKQFGGLIEWKSKVGVKLLPFKTEYMVGQAGFAVSASGLNVFYRGIDNPVEISVSGYPQERVNAYISGGGRLMRRGEDYVVKVTSLTTRKLNISVSVDTEDGRKNLGTKEFRVLNVPTPMAKLNGAYSEGKVHKDDVMGGILMASLGKNFFPFEVRFDVVSFTFAYTVRGQKATIPVQGRSLNTDAQQALRGLGRGTQINFESIKVKGPSGVVQTAPITLELR
ncbi:MAG: gliding motility protein GldM [Candidatus Delongbacteria bacterium]|jgi:gliding motility-associated protein GldM|nr:gliding motility protein GldM [Candidatus Delongbacteria bacterium]